VVHVPDSGEPEIIADSTNETPGEVSEAGAEFEADKFSTYTLVVHTDHTRSDNIWYFNVDENYNVTEMKGTLPSFSSIGTISSGGSIAAIFDTEGLDDGKRELPRKIRVRYGAVAGAEVGMAIDVYKNPKANNPVGDDDPIASSEYDSDARVVVPKAVSNTYYKAYYEHTIAIPESASEYISKGDTYSIVCRIDCAGTDNKIELFAVSVSDGEKGGTGFYQQSSGGSFVGLNFVGLNNVMSLKSEQVVSGDNSDFKGTINLTPSGDHFLETDGEESRRTEILTASLSDGSSRNIYYKSSNTGVVTVSPDNGYPSDEVTITAVAPGAAEITAEIRDNNNQVVKSTTHKVYVLSVALKNSDNTVVDKLEYSKAKDGVKPNSVVVNCGDDLIEDTHYKLTYSNNGAVGTATVTIKGKKKTDYEGFETTRTYTIEPRHFSTKDDFSFSNWELEESKTGVSLIERKAILLDSVGMTTLTYGSDYTASVKIQTSDTNGNYDFSKGIPCTIHISAGSTGNYTFGNDNVGIDLSDKIWSTVDLNVAISSIDLNSTYNYTYNGKDKEPTVTEFRTKMGGGEEKVVTLPAEAYRSLSDNSGWITYTNNVNANTNSSEKSVATVNGRSIVVSDGDSSSRIVSFTGSSSTSFEILPAETFEISDLEFSDDIDVVSNTSDNRSVYYTGSEIKPSVVVKSGGEELTEGEDYTIKSYTNNRYVTTADSPATVTVEGKGNYAGVTESQDFSILPLSLNDFDAVNTRGTVRDTNKIEKKYNGSQISIRMGETESALTSSNPADFIAYYTLGNGGKIYLTTNDCQTFEYYQGNNKVDAPEETGDYQLVIKPKEGHSYLDSATSLSVPVAVVSRSLSDSTVTWYVQKQIGDTTKTYNVSKAKDGRYSVNFEGAVEYDGTDIKMTTSDAHAGGVWGTDSALSRANKTLVSGTDFDISYDNNINASGGQGYTAKIILTGKNAYDKSSLEIFFTIEKRNIKNRDIQFIRNYGSNKAGVTIRDTQLNKDLIENTDYTLESRPASDPTGESTVEITGKGDYRGTVTKTYTYGTDLTKTLAANNLDGAATDKVYVTPKTGTTATRDGDTKTFNITYNGSAPEFQLTHVGYEKTAGTNYVLEEGAEKDYTISYYKSNDGTSSAINNGNWSTSTVSDTDRKNPGTYKAVVTGTSVSSDSVECYYNEYEFYYTINKGKWDYSQVKVEDKKYTIGTVESNNVYPYVPGILGNSGGLKEELEKELTYNNEENTVDKLGEKISIQSIDICKGTSITEDSTPIFSSINGIPVNSGQLDVGETYSLRIQLKDPANYTWTKDQSITLPFQIAPCVLDKAMVDKNANAEVTAIQGVLSGFQSNGNYYTIETTLGDEGGRTSRTYDGKAHTGTITKYPTITLCNNSWNTIQSFGAIGETNFQVEYDTTGVTESQVQYSPWTETSGSYTATNVGKYKATIKPDGNSSIVKGSGIDLTYTISN
ncbi:MAG: hypothetical protein IJ679_02400, partial [Lachnospiraceae bacterium]|nr:hypothetical protein [Lachnospiraceae bacterium]